MPSTDPGCKLKKPVAPEFSAFQESMNKVRLQGGHCVDVANMGEEVMNDGKVFMFDGPRPNADGDPSVGDSHIEKGEVHVSRRGFDGSPNTLAQEAQIFRHEVKHLLGWSHAQMQQPGYQCDG